MNRCKVSIWILLSLILLCIFSLTEIRKQCVDYLLLVENLESAVSQHQTGEALRTLEVLESHWETYQEINGIFVNGSELKSIREILSGLKPLIEQEQPAVTSEIQKMRWLILSVYQEEIPEIWHIL